MVYEEEINSISELARELEILDADAGIRLETRTEGKDIYIFITKSGQGYALAIYEKSKDSVGPGRRLEFRRFQKLKELLDSLNRYSDKRVRIFKY